MGGFLLPSRRGGRSPALSPTRRRVSVTLATLNQ
jgi:hypothetical protein